MTKIVGHDRVDIALLRTAQSIDIRLDQPWIVLLTITLAITVTALSVCTFQSVCPVRGMTSDSLAL